jgi:hypothetical protein
VGEMDGFERLQVLEDFWGEGNIRIYRRGVDCVIFGIRFWVSVYDNRLQIVRAFQN